MSSSKSHKTNGITCSHANEDSTLLGDINHNASVHIKVTQRTVRKKKVLSNFKNALKVKAKYRHTAVKLSV